MKDYKEFMSGISVINMKLGIIGAGYVGLTTAICLASLNHSITLYDVDQKKNDRIKQKKMPFYENNLQDLLEQVIDSNNLRITSDIDQMTENSDGCFICVGTPTNNDNTMNLNQIIEAVKTITKSIHTKKNRYTVIIRSTVIPGTLRKVVLPILEKELTSEQYSLCSVPEFLREGVAYNDFMNPDKIVIGGFDEKGINFVESIFTNFKDKAIFIKTNPESAELIKYTNNGFFSMLISFANEIANISEKIKNVDSYEIMRALITDKRISTKINDQVIIPELSSYLIPGCGFGGSCFPKDVRAIINFALENDVQTPLLNATMKINDERPKQIFAMIKSILGNLENKKISILGLTFKPDTDDMRSSPSLEVIKLLKNIGTEIHAFDPIISEKNVILQSDFIISKNLEECLQNSDLAVLFTKWPQFELLNSSFLKKYMKNPVIIDGRGFLDQKKFDKNSYYKIGFLGE